MPGVLFLEIDGLAHDVLRRALRDGNAPTLAAWLRERLPPARALGDRLVLADRRLPGRPAARLQRRHARLPLVGEGPRRGDRHQPPARRGGARAAPLRRPRAAARRRRQPRQHPLRRRAALDADDEHGAAPPAADRPRLLRLLRHALRGRAHARPGARRHRPRAPRGARPASARRAPADRPRRAPTRSCAPGRRSSSATSRSPPWSATCSPGGPSSTRPSSPTTRSPTTPGSSAHDALAVLRQLDRQIARIAAAADDAPRPYRLVVLSDHGQSQGETFLRPLRRDARGPGHVGLRAPTSSAAVEAARTTRSPTSAPA